MPPVPTTSWAKPRQDFQYLLTPREVHVWLASLRAVSPVLPQLRSCLSTDELAKALRFRLPGDQAAAVASRGILRHLLANYLRITPTDVALAYNAQANPPWPRTSGMD
jgi:4'-phosphopantetheinyl transferase